MLIKKYNQEVLNFFNGKPDYNVGLSLLMKFGTEKAVLLELFGKETDSKREKLFSILKNLIDKSKTCIPKSEAYKRTSVISIENNHSNSRKTVEVSENHFHGSNNNRFRASDSIPENATILESIRVKRAELYRLRSTLHNDLFNAISNETRKPLAFEIMRLSREIDEINNEFKDAQNGVIPERFVKVERTAEEYIKIDFTKKYVSKYKKLVANSDSVEKREHYQNLLEKHQKTLNQLLNGK